MLILHETIVEVVFQWVGVFLFIDVLSNIKVEKFDGNLEHLIIIQLHHHEQIPETSLADLNSLLVPINHCIDPIILSLEKLWVKVCDSPRKDFKNVSVLFLDRFEHFLYAFVIIWQWNQVVKFLGHISQHNDKLCRFFSVVLVNFKPCDFHKARQSIISEVVTCQHHDQLVNQICTNDVVHRNPTQKGIERFQAGIYKRGFCLVGVFENELTQLEDSREVTVHLLLQFWDLLLSHLVLWVVKDFLTENFQNFEVILANVHIFDWGRAYVTDEWLPSCVPLVLYDLDQDRVCFWQNVVQALLQVFYRSVV